MLYSLPRSFCFFSLKFPHCERTFVFMCGHVMKSACVSESEPVSESSSLFCSSSINNHSQKCPLYSQVNFPRSLTEAPPRGERNESRRAGYFPISREELQNKLHHMSHRSAKYSSTLPGTCLLPLPCLKCVPSRTSPITGPESRNHFITHSSCLTFAV